MADFDDFPTEEAHKESAAAIKAATEALTSNKKIILQQFDRLTCPTNTDSILARAEAHIRTLGERENNPNLDPWTPAGETLTNGRNVVEIHFRMNGTSLAHLLVPLVTQQSKRILSLSFFFYFSVISLSVISLLRLLFYFLF